MDIQFSNISQKSSKACLYLLTNINELSNLKNIHSDIEWLKTKIKPQEIIETYINGEYEAFLIDQESSKSELEKLRIQGYNIYKSLSKYNLDCININNISFKSDDVMAITEGIALSSYQFNKYKTKPSLFQLKSIHLSGPYDAAEYINLQAKVTGNFITKTLVNEHPAYLTPKQLSQDIETLSNEFGFEFTKLDKAQITSLKMGGLLAVNQASNEEPTFNILEWKPKKAKNKKPIILIGKGVVYDTGGLSLKPTPMAMDFMKADMAGAGAVVGTMCAIAKANLDLHVIGLIAATDNKIGSKAYSPGDVIKMYSGKTVEVLNTDAEGRLTLADALTYASKYNPEIVIDIATLTGSAARAIGTEGSVLMGTANRADIEKVKSAGLNVHERLVEFPLWGEYADQLKSDIADIKNIGSDMAGAITAGKFLEYFTDYPWMHIDIAAPSFLHHEDKYRGKNASGVGVRLFFDWLSKY